MSRLGKRTFEEFEEDQPRDVHFRESKRLKVSLSPIKAIKHCNWFSSIGKNLGKQRHCSHYLCLSKKPWTELSEDDILELAVVRDSGKEQIWPQVSINPNYSKSRSHFLEHACKYCWTFENYNTIKKKSDIKAKTKVMKVTPQRFHEVLTYPCAYCGKFYLSDDKTTMSVDRFNNDRPYETTNIVPSCGACNRAKAVYEERVNPMGKNGDDATRQYIANLSSKNPKYLFPIPYDEETMILLVDQNGKWKTNIQLNDLTDQT